jgi:hypothetical protein
VTSRVNTTTIFRPSKSTLFTSTGLSTSSELSAPPPSTHFPSLSVKALFPSLFINEPHISPNKHSAELSLDIFSELMGFAIDGTSRAAIVGVILTTGDEVTVGNGAGAAFGVHAASYMFRKNRKFIREIVFPLDCKRNIIIKSMLILICYPELLLSPKKSTKKSLSSLFQSLHQ